MRVANVELRVSGRFMKVARLRHEWFEYLDDPQSFVAALRSGDPIADVFTFLQEAHYPRPSLPFHRELDGASILAFKTYEDWWATLHFKVRNKARKVHKTGVELRHVELDDEFVRGVKSIYDESPIRQDRRFPHFGKSLEVLKEELSSFLDRSLFVGAYHKGELVGFMKLYEGHDVLRTIHVIAKLSHRDKCVMDGLIARAVEICDERRIGHLHYGDWAHGGLGTFRAKFGFERHECPRYFVPLSALGRLMMPLRLHRSLKEHLPQDLIDNLVVLRRKWYAINTPRSS